MRRILVVLLVLASFGLWARGAIPCSVLDGQPACRAEFLPGPALDALGVVDVGADTIAYTSTGELVFTTVRVDTSLTLLEWVRGVTDPNVDLVDRDLVIPPGQDESSVSTQNAARMDESQIVATLAALGELGEAPPAPLGAEVQGLADPELRSFDQGQLDTGDVIVSVDGVATEDADEVVAALGELQPGDDVTFVVLRPTRTEPEVVETADGPAEGDGEVVVGRLADAERREVTLRLAPNPEDPTRPLVGVLLGTKFELAVDVGIDAGEIGGPSAGLMFALAIVDRLTPEDLTSGAVVAGTGTITVDGDVGSIGGIRQKVVGATARENGGSPATIFLTPARQLDEAATAEIDSPLTLVPVATLGEAVAALRALADGRTPVGAIEIGPGAG